MLTTACESERPGTESSTTPLPFSITWNPNRVAAISRKVSGYVIVERRLSSGNAGATVKSSTLTTIFTLSGLRVPLNDYGPRRISIAIHLTAYSSPMQSPDPNNNKDASGHSAPPGSSQLIQAALSARQNGDLNRAQQL